MDIENDGKNNEIISFQNKITKLGEIELQLSTLLETANFVTKKLGDFQNLDVDETKKNIDHFMHTVKSVQKEMTKQIKETPTERDYNQSIYHQFQTFNLVSQNTNNISTRLDELANFINNV